MSMEESVIAIAPKTIRENRRVSARVRALPQAARAGVPGDSVAAWPQEGPLAGPGSDSQAVVRLAQSPWEHLQAFHLLYEQYLPFGYTRPNENRLRISRWNGSPASHTFIAERNGQAVGTLTCLEDGPAGIPAEQTHGALLPQLRASGLRIAEMTSLAVSSGERGPFTLLSLIRVALSYCRGILGVSDWVCTVNPRHVSFYRKVMLLEELGQPLACRTANGAPGALLRLNLSTMERRYKLRYGARAGALNLHEFFFEPAAEEARLAELRAAAAKRIRNLEVLQRVLGLLGGVGLVTEAEDLLQRRSP